MANSAPTENRDVAISTAASVVLGKVFAQTSDANTTARQLIQAIMPLYGVSCDRAVIRRADNKSRIDKLFWPLRNSKLPTAEYGRLGSFFMNAYGAVSPLPGDLSGWRLLTERFRFGAIHGRQPLLDAVTFLAAREWPTPGIWG